MNIIFHHEFRKNSLTLVPDEHTKYHHLLRILEEFQLSCISDGSQVEMNLRCLNLLYSS
jgi:hypothetical protein